MPSITQAVPIMTQKRIPKKKSERRTGLDSEETLRSQARLANRLPVRKFVSKLKTNKPKKKNKKTFFFFLSKQNCPIVGTLSQGGALPSLGELSANWGGRVPPPNVHSPFGEPPLSLRP